MRTIRALATPSIPTTTASPIPAATAAAATLYVCWKRGRRGAELLRIFVEAF